MRIADNVCRRLIALGALAFFASANGVFAIAYADPVPSAALPATSVSAPAVPVPGMSAPSVTVPPTLEVSVPAAANVAPPAPQNEDVRKTVSAMEDKVTESAKGAVKRLDVGNESTSLADLNNARQTVTRIEAMIELEKHLVELDKLRNDHGNSSQSTTPSPSMLPLQPMMPNFANAIPASALIPLPHSMPVAVENHAKVETQPPRNSLEQASVLRIFGTDGRYTAVVKFANGETKSLRIGDRANDDAFVRNITPSSVVVVGKKNTYTMYIKNIDMIYSAQR